MNLFPEIPGKTMKNKLIYRETVQNANYENQIRLGRYFSFKGSH